MSRERIQWVDYTKVIACVLVLLGHFFQSMTKASILPENAFYQWFNTTVYYFHVPLFFICSGYLYQKFSRVCDLHSWIYNVLKKLINLGIPYAVFTVITWSLKSFFSGSVNDEITYRLLSTLLLHPTSPYWYLYTLFFIFLITPTFRNKKVTYLGFIAALSFKFISLIGIGGGQPYMRFHQCCKMKYGLSLECV